MALLTRGYVLSSSTGTSLLHLPHAIVSDNTNQTVASITVPQAITFDTNEDIHGITHSTSENPSYITMIEDGIYFFTVSAIANSTKGTRDTLDIWVSIDGTPLTNSDTRVAVPNGDTEVTLSVSFLIHLNAAQRVEFMMCGGSTNAQILATAASVADPVRPACPSIIVTVNKIAELNGA